MSAEPAVRALVRAIRDVDAPERLDADLDRFLRSHGLSESDIARMGAFGASRLKAYRALVHNRVRNTVDDFIPRVADRLGLARMSADVAAFIDERAMRAPYLRDVPAEFVAWALPRWRADRTVPAFIPDLARHELLRFDIKNSPRGGEPATGRPIDLERPIRVDGSSVVMRYRWAVHALPAARSDRSEPDLRDSCIVAFRGRDQKTHTIDCKPWVAALVERLIAGDTLRVALFGALAACEMPLDDDILARTAIVLADFLDQELLLGAE